LQEYEIDNDIVEHEVIIEATMNLILKEFKCLSTQDTGFNSFVNYSDCFKYDAKVVCFQVNYKITLSSRDSAFDTGNH
jgi:hypothetical protein